MGDFSPKSPLTGDLFYKKKTQKMVMYHFYGSILSLLVGFY
jgi:hypothetical protein